MVALDLVLTADYRGMLVAGRAFLLVRFWVRAPMGGNTIDGCRWFEGGDEDDGEMLPELFWAAVDEQEDDAPAVIQETVTRHSGDI
jgi:hypothetical protein